MARIRYNVLVNDKTKGATETKATITEDLPTKGILSELHCQVTYTKVSTNDRPLPDWEAVTKIELLVKGSTVVKSLSGKQVRQLMWYNGGPFTQSGSFWGAGGSTDTYTNLILYLGKFAGDTKNGLDLGRYENPQVKITYDTSLTSVDGNTYDAATSPTFKYNLMAKLFDGRPAGFTDRFVQSSQIKSYTTANSTEINTEVPKGFGLKNLIFGASYKNIGYTHIPDRVKLDFDNGSWVPIDVEHENMKAMHLSWWPKPVIAAFWTTAASSDDFDTQCFQINSINSSNTGGTTAAISYDAHEMGLHDVAKYTYAGAAATGQDIGWIQVMGWGPHQSYNIPMEELVDGSLDNIDTNAFGRIDLKLTTGASAGTSAVMKVVAEYLKPNGA